MMNEADDDEIELMEGRGGGSSYVSPRQQRFLKKGLILFAIVIGISSVLALIIGLATSKAPPDNDNHPHPNPPPAPAEQEWNSFRLPTTAHPLQYNLHLEPNMKTFNYTILEEVEIEITNSTIQTIIMNSVGLQISNVVLRKGRIDSPSVESITPQNITYNEDLELVMFHFGSPLFQWLQNGDRIFTMSMRVDANMQSIMAGFYPSSYLNGEGKEEWIAATDLEPTGARSVFVAFDEPKMKAGFKLSVQLNTAENWTALSNMPQHHVSNSSDTQVIHFANSVNMSTYLFCVIISKFDHVSDNSARIPIRVFTVPEKVSQAKYAAKTSADILTNYERYYDIPYALPKMDVISIPNYAAGAMENWGLITFRENYLLYDEVESSLQDKQDIAGVLSHEIAHQWFGNLVTMNWWSDLWLNEGFATFMEYVGVHSINPEWDMWTQFLFYDRARALSIDSLTSSHAVALPIEKMEEISQQFDAISYAKGGSIIRMLQAYMNRENTTMFEHGITHYLNSHKFGNAETSELWASLELVSNNSEIGSFMRTWTEKMGFPYLTIEKPDTGSSIKVTQSRFLAVQTTEPSEDLWWVPIELQKPDGQNEFHLLKERSTSLSFPSDGHVVVNPEGTGYYRVLYKGQLFESLLDQLSTNSSAFDTATRAVLIDDTFAFTFAGISNITEAMRVVSYLSQEREYVPWLFALTSLDTVSSLISYEPFYGTYKKFVHSLVMNATATIGWESQANESHTTQLLRPFLLRVAGSVNHNETIVRAKEIFAAAMSNSSYLIPVDLRGAVYRIVASTGGETEYEYFLNRYLSTNVATEKERCLTALTSFSQPYLIQRTLSMSLDTKYVKSQDTYSVISQVASNLYGRDLVWEFVRENLAILRERYEGSSSTLGGIISRSASSFSTKTKLKEVETFFKENNVESASRSISQTIERIKANIQWLEKNRGPLSNWLNEWQQHLNH